MANPEHLATLHKGVETWNRWRQEERVLRPDLSGADLWGANLRGVNFSGSVLRGAILTDADLGSADLRGADLSAANLGGTDLSKSTIDTATRYETVIGCDVGVNGFYSQATDSAALMRIDPPGNSMQGANVNAVIESLNVARKLHTFSLILAGIALLFIVIKPKSITLPYLAGSFRFDALSYAFLATILSTGMLTLVATFIDSALQGVRYLNDRRSAMTVAHFPWLLSKYEHDPGVSRKSRVMRFLLSYHPVVYLYFFVKWESVFTGDWEAIARHYMELPVILAEVLLPFFFVMLMMLCRNIYRLSEGFQKPILFDTATERDRRSDMERLAEAVEKQSSTIGVLIQLLEEKRGVKER
ncbi:MAG: pentapeptide repeat-containing protein [Chlorobium sp.]|jgi:uncharacterized protein YjbI with pentapeptide repeats|nr:pentapeptide repeat-containing protein [Chlorobium sp.]